MNYIQEINQFYIRTETNPVSPSAGILWHALMHINNRAKWVRQFTVAASVLCAKSGLSLSTLKRARLELKEKGYIRVTSRGTKAPIYQMVSSTAEKVTQDEDQELSQVTIKEEEMVQTTEASGQVMDQEVSEEVNQELGPLYKQNEIKQNQTNHSINKWGHDIYQFYCANFGTLTDYIQRELNTAMKQYSGDIVYEALKRADENDKTTWRYAKGILKKWEKDGVQTIADITVAESRFRRERQAKQGSTRYVAHTKRQEVIPDWFREDRLKRGIIV